MWRRRGIVGVLVMAAAAGVGGCGDDEGPQQAARTTDRPVLRPDPRGCGGAGERHEVPALGPLRVTARIDVTAGQPTGSPESVAAGCGGVWVSSHDNPLLLRVDPRRDAVADVRHTGLLRGGQVTLAEGLVLLTAAEGAVFGLEAATGRTATLRPDSSNPGSAVLGAGGLWVEHMEGALTRTDLTRGRVTARVPVTLEPGGLTTADGAVWLADRGRRELWRIDPSAARVVARVPVGPGAAVQPHSSADGRIWVANRDAGTVTRVDARRSAASATVRVGGAPSRLVATRDGVWVVTARGPRRSELVGIDPSTAEVRARVRLPDTGEEDGLDVAAGFGALWVSSFNESVVLKLEARR